MNSIRELIEKLENEGYSELNAQARISQDILLKAIKSADIVNNVTIKGGVLMRNISQDIRRATVDLDIDFVKYSINNDVVRNFIDILNKNSEYQIEIVDEIEELKHEDYKGKRVYVNIKDENNEIVNSKIDIGVHTYNELKLEECIFDISIDGNGISLLANSKEQIVVEKLKSLLKFGTESTRYKDIFDIYYLLDKIDNKKLDKYLKILIYDFTKYKNKELVSKRINEILLDKKFIEEIEKSNKNWINENINDVIKDIIKFFEK